MLDLEKIEAVILSEMAKSDNGVIDNTRAIRKTVEALTSHIERVYSNTTRMSKWDVPTRHALEHIVAFIGKRQTSYEVAMLIDRWGLSGDAIVDKHRILAMADKIAIEYKPWWRARPYQLKHEVKRIIEESSGE